MSSDIISSESELLLSGLTGEISSAGRQIISLHFLLYVPLGVSTSYGRGAISSPTVPFFLQSGQVSKACLKYSHFSHVLNLVFPFDLATCVCDLLIFFNVALFVFCFWFGR